MRHPRFRPVDEWEDVEEDERLFVERQLALWLTLEFLFAETQGHLTGHPTTSREGQHFEIDRVQRFVDGLTLDVLRPARTLRSHIALAYVRPDEGRRRAQARDRFDVIPAARRLAELSLLIQAMDHVRARPSSW
jgi:hypothetical protein